MLKCILWDFGDTLADERWMLQDLPGTPGWSRVWSEIASGELADAWNRGEISLSEVVHALSARLGLEPDRVRAHVEWCCTRVQFFPSSFNLARQVRLPQALVTVNPDGFSELVVPHYGLAAIFSPIVTSWQEHTLDKAELCFRALERIGGNIEPAQALLIDNRPDCIEAWSTRGGFAYLFRGESEFNRDLRGRELSELRASVG